MTCLQQQIEKRATKVQYLERGDEFSQLLHMDMATAQHPTTWRQETARRFFLVLPLPLSTSMWHLACGIDYLIILISI